eukprot:CAMPEP_0181050494 /NCGR_PEP_ID=MMETSP1070-20121207/16547_1 /TAXON_ID=265543 /ORGANISM="Minutocellus polymorphus, Strain NH13" /LENGTH=49 /DNA_ID= /DNA_START= /DNA_END= /DNA_ORIENTATION=
MPIHASPLRPSRGRSSSSRHRSGGFATALDASPLRRSLSRGGGPSRSSP